MAAGARIFVGNLPYSIDEAQLRAWFEQQGHAVHEVKLVHDRDTGRPRGFGFVELGSPAEAEACIAALQGHELGGRTLTIRSAHERGGGGAGRGGRT